MRYIPFAILFLCITSVYALPAPQWLQPVQNEAGVDISSFRFHIAELANVSGEDVFAHLEVYKENVLVWQILAAEEYRISAPEGEFIGITALSYNTTYNVRARYVVNSTPGNWSETRFFSTQVVPIESSDILWRAKQGLKVEPVLTGISLPTTLHPAPVKYTAQNEPKLYFLELYGKISILTNDGQYVVYADNLLNFKPTDPIPGAGEVGLTGIYVDPSGDVYVTVVYNHPQGWGLFGRVDKYTSAPDGRSPTNVTTLIDMIPVAPAHQVHTITRGPDGKLYVQTGDDDQPSKSADLSVLSGKIFRMNDDGSDVEVYAHSLRNPYGGDWSPDGELFITNNGPSKNDALYKVAEGSSFGWDGETQEKDTNDLATNAWYLWADIVAPTQMVFLEQNSIFGTRGDIIVSLLGPSYLKGPSVRGKRIVALPSNTELVRYTGPGYGTPVGVTVLNDGLYFSDIYGENGFGATGVQGNIYRIVASDGTETPENEETPESEETETPAPLFCTLETLNVTCSGTIVQDLYDGCRHITCAAGNESISVAACDKPTAEEPTFFEMWIVNTTSSNLRVCIEDACVSQELSGFTSRDYSLNQTECAQPVTPQPVVTPPATVAPTTAPARSGGGGGGGRGGGYFPPRSQTVETIEPVAEQVVENQEEVIVAAENETVEQLENTTVQAEAVPLEQQEESDNQLTGFAIDNEPGSANWRSVFIALGALLLVGSAGLAYRFKKNNS